jgi:hypothetical protein
LRKRDKRKDRRQKELREPLNQIGRERERERERASLDHVDVDGLRRWWKKAPEKSDQLFKRGIQRSVTQ